MASDALLLAEAFGSLAKGFKLLRKYALKQAKKAGTPPESEESEESEEETESDAPAPTLTLPGFDHFFTDYGISKLAFPLTPGELLTRPRTRAFGAMFVNLLFSTLVGGRVRASKYRTAWVKDEGTRRGWRNISHKQLHGVYAMVHEYYEDCVRLVQNTTYEEFYANVGKVSQFKWKRRAMIVDAEVTWGAFLKFVQGQHRELPSVCGHKLKKKNPQNK